MPAAGVTTLWIRSRLGMKKPSLREEEGKRPCEVSEAKVGDEGSGVDCGAFSLHPRGQRQILFDELLQSARICASENREDVGDVARALALKGHAMRNLSGRDLKRLLRGRHPKIVERLAGLAKRQNDLGFLATLRLFGETRSGTLGVFKGGGGSLVVFHMLHSLAVEVLEAELPLAGMDVSEATRARKFYFG